MQFLLVEVEKFLLIISCCHIRYSNFSSHTKPSTCFFHSSRFIVFAHIASKGCFRVRNNRMYATKFAITPQHLSLAVCTLRHLQFQYHPKCATVLCIFLFYASSYRNSFFELRFSSSLTISRDESSCPSVIITAHILLFIM